MTSVKTYPPVVDVDEHDNEIGSAMLTDACARQITEHPDDFTPGLVYGLRTYFPGIL